MKKIILLLALSFGMLQAYAQPGNCTFTYTVSGNTATFTPQPFAVVGTTVFDSLVYDYGDNTGTFNIPLSQTSNSHTYATSGTYNVCHTYYMHQLGSPTNGFTCNFCDSVTIGNTFPCTTTIQTSVLGNTITSNAMATGGTAPYLYQYVLNPGNVSSTTGTFTGLANGAYSVCVLAIDAMQNTCSVACDSAFVGSVLGCNTNVTVQTSGATSILASAAASFGTPPYTYSYTLNPGNITNNTGSFAGLTPGLYTVCATATDANNITCTPDCDSVFVGNAPGCNTSIQVAASGNAVAATASATFGTPPYSYSYTLNPGNITNTTGLFPGLTSGGYIVCATATDANNITCTPDCDSVWVGGSPVGCNTQIALTASGNSIAATAAANFGTAPYSYSYTLNPGNITNSTGLFTGLNPGTYIVCATATDANNIVCATDCDSISVGNTFGCNTSVTATASGTTINAVATASFGTAPYTYSYTLNPGNITNSTGVFTGLAPGGYAIVATATDANNVTCTPDIDSTWIGNGPGSCFITAQFTQNINALNVNFINNSTIAGGTITSTNWSFGDGNFSTANSPSHTYASPNTYTVTLVVTGVDANQVPCADSTIKQMTLSYPSAVNDVQVNALNIYPNPTSNNFIIELPEGEKMEKLLITDVAGRKISANYGQTKNKYISVSLNKQASGIYFIKLQTNNQLYTSSIMKQE